MLDRNLIRNIDWMLIGLLLLNSIIGVIYIYSCTHHSAGNYYLKQFFWIIISSAALFLFLALDYKSLVNYSLYFYIAFIGILASIFLFGRLISGARRWFQVPFFNIQPSEVTKVVLILLLAHVFSEFRKGNLSLGKGILSCAIVTFPGFLVALQPDLGTALSYIPIILAALFLAGMNRKIVIFLLILTLSLGVFVWNYGLKDYQRKRINTLIFPSQDPLGAGYHVNQSKIAIGSGGLLGKGYKKGSQSQLKFLPARHTDFIFSVIGEESGFLGVVVALGAYFLFLWRLFQSLEQSRDRAGVYIVFMVTVMIAFQFFINVMMVIGLFPISGIPLPLLSYGGSSLLANYLGVSLVLNVKMRRFVNV